MAYGFAPSAPLTIEVRSSTAGGSVSGHATEFGTAVVGVASDSGFAPGQYKVTATSGTTSVSVLIQLAYTATGAILSVMPEEPVDESEFIPMHVRSVLQLHPD